MDAYIEPKDKTISGENIEDIRQQLIAMLSVSGPRGLTAITESGTEIHVELYEGGDYIRTKAALARAHFDRLGGVL